MALVEISHMTLDIPSLPQQEEAQYNEDDVIRSEQANEAPVWSILPSYHMYKSLYMGMNVDEDANEPPTYEDVSHNSAVASSTTTSSLSLHNASSSAPSSTEPRVIVADESTNDWQNTLLDNIHQLKNLTHSDNKISNALKVSVHFTKEVGKMGKKPTCIDPLVYEYKQGDTVNGYVLFENTSDKPIPFDMMYVVFEGSFLVANSKDKADRMPVSAKQFLQMFDFSASWNHANIDRLITDHTHPYQCPDLVDPIDNTRLGVTDRTIHPNRIYKRFFTFKIPTQLLDSECAHNLLGHTHIPPSLGSSREERAKYSSLEARELRVRDLSFVDSSISYGVMTRLIGKSSMYNLDETTDLSGTRLINSKGDEFVILKDLNEYMRMVPEPAGNTLGEHLMKVTESKMLHENLLNRLKQKIDIGHNMLGAMRKGNFDFAIDIADQERTFETSDEHMNELMKSRQLYNACLNRDSKNPKMPVETYGVAFPFAKKSIIGSAKLINSMVVSTPKINRIVRYISPLRFRPDANQKIDNKSWKLEVPLDFTFTIPATADHKSVKLPDLKSVDVELVALTWKSPKYALPYELNHDIIFKDRVAAHFSLGEDVGKVYGSDNINTIYKEPFQQLSNQLVDLLRKLGSDNFKIQAQLVDDVKSICSLETKHMNMPVSRVTVHDPKDNAKLCKLAWLQKDANTYLLQINVAVDLETLLLKGEQAENVKAHSKYCLVTSFQSCTVGRLYYLKVVLKLSNNDYVRFLLPITVEKSA